MAKQITVELTSKIGNLSALLQKSPSDGLCPVAQGVAPFAKPRRLSSREGWKVAPNGGSMHATLLDEHISGIN